MSKTPGAIVDGELIATDPATGVPSFARLQRVEPGFEPEGVFVAQLAIPAQRYDRPKLITFYEQFYQRLTEMPGVTAVALSDQASLNALRFWKVGSVAGVGFDVIWPVTAFIAEHKERFGVEPICTALQVAPSTYYSAKKRPPCRRKVRDAELKAARAGGPLTSSWRAVSGRTTTTPSRRRCRAPGRTRGRLRRRGGRARGRR